MAPNATNSSPQAQTGAPYDGPIDTSTKCISVSSEAKKRTPKLGPEPTLLSRRQVDALYSLLEAVTAALKQLEIPYILTGGSLLGAIRQHSILFCDDDIDLAILESGDGGMYERAKSQLPELLGKEYRYYIKPWEGGDKVRIKSCSNVFLDIFVIRKYNNTNELVEVIGAKRNGDKQSDEYVRGIVDTINKALHSQGEINAHGNEMTVNTKLSYPIWHFNTRKAIELWPKEVYRDCEMFPTIHNLKMGPVIGLSGPSLPVWLLKRAFGSDCFRVYYQSMSHGNTCAAKRADAKELALPEGNGESKNHKQAKPQSNLPPVVGSGGQWQQSIKAALSEEQYLPMQPVLKAKRRHTFHDASTLFEYLKSQSKDEAQHLRNSGVLHDNNKIEGRQPTKDSGKRTIYMDGVFDLFHIGHLNAIQQCAALGDRVIIGVTGDDDASSYKRPPIISQSGRTAIIKSLKVVDDVVCPCPLVVTKDFMRERGIDLVVHGFADPKDKDRQQEFFQIAMDEGKFEEIEYYSQLSTTDILKKIRAEDEVKNEVNPKWFGATFSVATSKSPCIPYDPFPLHLRNAIEQHLRKATKRRQDALLAIRDATGNLIYEETMAKFNGKYSEEGVFDFDTDYMQLREKFLQSCGLPPSFDLSRLHERVEPNFKDEMLFAFAREHHHFQEMYDEFVRSVCCPFVASMSEEPIDEIYYQSFPCVRVVRPGDFSIGPHADGAYGHNPCSINFYIPLTKIEGSASLFLESRCGSEDWHPIEGEYGIVKHFAGAICAHWTPENNHDFTRVSLDFRIIPGPMYHALKCGGKQSGGVRDVYREKAGYYSRSCCKTNNAGSAWDREGPLQVPDARVGFPWTKFKPTR